MSIVQDGLPPLPRTSVGSGAQGAENRKHERAGIVPGARGIRAFPGIRSRLAPARPSLTWAHVPSGERVLRDYGSEADIAKYAYAVLVDVAEALQPVLGDVKLSVISELDVFGDRADFWVLRRHGVPVGVVGSRSPAAPRPSSTASTSPGRSWTTCGACASSTGSTTSLGS